MSDRFNRRFLLFAFVLCLGVLEISGSHLLAGEKQLSNKRVNYKLVSNLQEIEDPSPSPDFTLPDVERGKVSLKDFRGKLLMLNFWASWCVPCREEMPAMERLYQRYKDQGFVILGVNLQDDKKSAISFVKELKITFPIAFDPKGEVGLLYGAWGLPATYLIDANGIALARAWGPADWYSPGARELVETLLDVQKRSK
ncbi:MAG TPA: TlpA disulfide reductase family protein [Candidatus Binatia bacterium]|nr:TlpA disulfide reductase family protein [Candidatus Binatia bacterium]